MFMPPVHLWLDYLIRCKGPNRIHSPFVYDLYFHHILERRSYYAFADLNKIRGLLLASDEVLEGEDFGAGKFAQRKVSHVASKALQPAQEAELLFRLLNYFKPQTIVELGTSLGLTTLYMHFARPSADVHTFEGHAGTADFARRLFAQHANARIHLHRGAFADTLPAWLADGAHVDFVFLDGDHRFEPVLNNANMLKPALGDGSVVVVDDIRWSAGMWKAWKALCDDPFWDLKLDLGKLGLLIRRKAQTPEQFVLRYPR